MLSLLLLFVLNLKCLISTFKSVLILLKNVIKLNFNVLQINNLQYFKWYFSVFIKSVLYCNYSVNFILVHSLKVR